MLPGLKLNLLKQKNLAVDRLRCRCQISRVKTKKPVQPKTEPETPGMKLVEKYRPRMSQLTDTERQNLMARGLQIIYGDTPATKSTHRG
jgi:hypothetical protein